MFRAVRNTLLQGMFPSHVNRPFVLHLVHLSGIGVWDVVNLPLRHECMTNHIVATSLKVCFVVMVYKQQVGSQVTDVNALS